MNKKILWYALAINVATSFLGALLYQYFCDSKQLYCGDIVGANQLAIFFPTVISGTVIILIAYFIARWLKRVWWLFFVIIAFFALMFNGGEGFEIKLEVVGALPSILAAVAAWFLGREKKSGAARPPSPSAPPASGGAM